MGFLKYNKRVTCCKWGDIMNPEKYVQKLKEIENVFIALKLKNINVISKFYIEHMIELKNLNIFFEFKVKNRKERFLISLSARNVDFYWELSEKIKEVLKNYHIQYNIHEMVYMLLQINITKYNSIDEIGSLLLDLIELDDM